MLSRRQIFAGLSLLALSQGLASCAARATTTAGGSSPATSVTIPTVGPHASWNGTALSGSINSAPNDTTGIYARTAAGKPVARFLQPGGQRLWQDTYIGVVAYAQGGIASVTFKGDCATTVVTTPSLRTYTGSDGVTKSNYGYWILLSPALFTKVTGSGNARIFAEIVANNGSMARRIIGCADADPANHYLADWTQVFYPRATESDFNKTIGQGGADYTSIDAFFNAARAVNAECPVGTFITTGTYAANDGASGTSGTGSAKGFAVLKAANGITATINRSSQAWKTNVHAQDQTFVNLNPNKWRPGWPSIEFRGVGIVLDRQYWNMLNVNGSPWFNGCKVTNSASTGIGKNNWAFYNNGMMQMELGTRDDGSNNVFSFWMDATNEYGASNCAFQYLVDGVKQRFIPTTVFHANPLIINTYLTDVDAETPYHQTHPVIKIWYTGTGSNPCWNMKGWSHGGGPTTWPMYLKVNGSVAFTIPITDITGAGPLWIDELVAYINTNCGPDWHAQQLTGSNGDYLGARYLDGDGSDVAVTNSSTAATAINTFVDFHTEWVTMQGSPYGTNHENILHANNTTLRCRWTTGIYPWLFISDGFVINNGFISAGGNNPGADTPYGGDSGFVSTTDNVAFANNDYDGGFNSWDLSLSNTCTAFLNNIEYFHTSTNADNPYPSYINNLLSLGSGHTPNGVNSAGNVELKSGSTSQGNSTEYYATYTNKATGDLKPAGKKLTNLFAQTFAYDRNYNPRNMTADAAGSSAIGYPEPARPF